MPGVAFPPVGPVGLGSPLSSVLCAAQTATLPISGRFACRSLPDTSPASVCLWFPLRAHGRVEALDHARAFGHPVPSSGSVVKEREGSPTFPRSPCVGMPRSQTPVVSRPLALARTGLLPSRRCILSAFEPVARSYPWSTTIHFSEFSDAACVLALPLLRTLPFSSRSSVRLPTWWLAFGRVGLESASHPLGNIDMFQEVSPPFPRAELLSARAAGLLGGRLIPD